MGFISRIQDRQAEITAQIAALVAERDELDAALRVFDRLGAEQESTAPRLDRDPDGGASARERESRGPTSEEQPAGTQAPPVDNNSPEGASEEVGGFPVAATPQQCGATGGADEADSHVNANADVPGVTTGRDREAGESPASRSATPGKPAEPSGSAAPSLRSRIEALHKEHPEYTAKQAKTELGCKTSSLTAYSTQLQIKWAPERGDVEGLADKVVALHREHPDWPASRIARQLGRTGGYVRATAKRRELILPSERTAEPQQPRQETQERPDDVPVIPVDLPSTERTGEEAGAVVELPRAARPLSGSKFYLINDEGLYLNRYCAGFTANKREAWIGNERQLSGCRRNFEIARDLSERAVTKASRVPINSEVA